MNKLSTVIRPIAGVRYFVCMVVLALIFPAAPVQALGSAKVLGEAETPDGQMNKAPANDETVSRPIDDDEMFESRVTPKPASKISPRVSQTEDESDDDESNVADEKDERQTKLKIRSKPGITKIKYQIDNGTVVLKIEDESGEEITLEKEELDDLEDELEDELEKEGLKFQPTKDKKLALSQKKAALVTEFPVSIHVETKELLVTTPTGQKVVTVLPEAAMELLLASGKVQTVDTLPEGTEDLEELDSTSGVIKLEIRDDQVVYKINGKKIRKLFGVIPVNVPLTAVVSANSGKTVAIEQSFLSKIINLLST